jgi:hypothetical protein
MLTAPGQQIQIAAYSPPAKWPLQKLVQSVVMLLSFATLADASWVTQMMRAMGLEERGRMHVQRMPPAQQMTSQTKLDFGISVLRRLCVAVLVKIRACLRQPAHCFHPNQVQHQHRLAALFALARWSMKTSLAWVRHQPLLSNSMEREGLLG